MKSATRTILNTTLTSASSYSSGTLDVGDVFELALDMEVTQISPQNATLEISRIGADGALYSLQSIVIGTTGKISSDIGASLPINRSFGDQIQLDLTTNVGTTITTSLSIKGKG